MKLVLQRGHVGRTTGSTGAPGEQQLATRVAARVRQLAPRGVEVVVIDADEPTHRYRGDAFVALHGDGSSNPKVGGASVGYRNAAGRELAERWKACYAARGWPFGFRADNYTTNLSRYYGTGKAITAGNQRAVILEHGFLTNPKERAWLESDDGITVAAVAILEAVTRRRVITPTPARNDEHQEEPTMDKGASGPAVQRVQEALDAWGRSRGRELLPKYGPDGDYGQETADAVAAYQRAAGLPATGRVDGITAALVLRYLPVT